MNMVIHYTLHRKYRLLHFCVKGSTQFKSSLKLPHTQESEMDDVTQRRLGDTKKFGLHNTILPPKNADNRAGFHGFFSLLLLSMTLLMLCHGDVTHQLHTYTHCRVAYSVYTLYRISSAMLYKLWTWRKAGGFFDQCVLKLLYMVS